MDSVREENIEEAPKIRDDVTSRRLIRLMIWIPLILLTAVMVFSLFTRKEDGAGKMARPKIGEKARDFTYVNLDDRPVTLSDLYGRKVIVINIWATWCTSCRKELPTLQAMYNQLKGEDLEVLAVSIDALGTKAIVPFMKKYGLDLPVLQNLSGDIQHLYGTTGVPESFVVDKQGRIALVEVGAGDWSAPGRISFLKSLMEEPDRTELPSSAEESDLSGAAGRLEK